MSLYNMLFGKNPNADLVLSIVGLREVDVERFRDVSISEDGCFVEVYSRTGGGNREDYPQHTMRHRSEWMDSVDDDFDCTYCTDRLKVPEEFVEDVRALSDPLEYGIRKEFAQHVAKTLRRESTEADLNAAARAKEHQALSRTRHVMANGHTFVPYDDQAMKQALECAENNGGELLTAWGIMPLVLEVETNHRPYPKAPRPEIANTLERVRINCRWRVDEDYWAHVCDRFSAQYPASMARIAEAVGRLRERG